MAAAAAGRPDPAAAAGGTGRPAAAWLHREQQMAQLRALLQLPAVPDILVFGPSCTGKTSIVKDLLAGRPHAYASCSRSLKLRGLLSSVLAQLTQGGKRKRAQAFAGAAGSESALIWELKAACPPDQPCRVLVLDEVQQLLAASDGPLGPLLAMREQAGVNLALLLVSRVQPAALGLLGVLPGVVSCPFPAYSDAQLVDILAAAGPPSTSGAGSGAQAQQQAQQPEQQAQAASTYRRFLAHTLVPQFHRLSRCLPDVASQAAALWPHYIASAQQAHAQDDDDDAAAAQDQEPPADEGVDEEARMYSAVQPKLTSALGNFQPAACCTLQPLAAGAGGAAQQRQAAVRTGVTGAHLAAGLELSKLSKLLLVAAFLVSRNKPSLDRQLFTNGAAGWRGRGGRRRNAMAADRQAEAAKAAELKGPHTFSLTRLTAVYSSLLAADGGGGGSGGSATASARGGAQQQQHVTGLASAGWLGVQRSDVLMGVASLVAARLLSQACDDVLEAPRYSCEAPQELVERVAVDCGITLSSYLLYV